MLSVVVQNDFVKYDIDNYYVEGNKIRSYVDRMMGGERISILNLAEYKTYEEAVWVFKMMVGHENSGGPDHVYLLPSQERVEAELRMRNRRDANE